MGMPASIIGWESFSDFAVHELSSAFERKGTDTPNNNTTPMSRRLAVKTTASPCCPINASAMRDLVGYETVTSCRVAELPNGIGTSWVSGTRQHGYVQYRAVLRGMCRL